MKKLALTVALTFAAAGIAAAQTIIVDGCAATKVEGANYYNFDNPRCVTESAKFSSSKGEDKRAELVDE